MKKKKRAVTLIEIMIVILLIGLISGVLAYNFKGSLDQGKAFKSEQGANQVKSILQYELACGKWSFSEVTEKWQEIIQKSSLAGKPQELVKDGWGEVYSVDVDLNTEDIMVTSKKYEAYKAKKG